MSVGEEASRQLCDHFEQSECPAMVEEAILLKSNNEQEQEEEETHQQEFVQEKHRASCAVIIWR